MRATLSERICGAAFRKLFPGSNNLEARRQFIQLLRKEYKELGCAVFWARSDSAKAFLKRFNLDSGKKEVVITDNYHLLFSEDWRREPTPILF